MIQCVADRSTWADEGIAEELKWWQDHPPPDQAGAVAISKAIAERFGLAKDEFVGKAVLVIGPGPTGQMEWFDRAEMSIAVDPLINEYQKMGAPVGWYDGRLPCGAEDIQFPSVRFDWVLSWNALDHGYNLGLAVRNMARVLAPGGKLLLSVGCDLIHHPCKCHPLKLHPQAVTACLVAAGLKITKTEQGRMPVGTDAGIVMADTLSGGPVFHWWATK